MINPFSEQWMPTTALVIASLGLVGILAMYRAYAEERSVESRNRMMGLVMLNLISALHEGLIASQLEHGIWRRHATIHGLIRIACVAGMFYGAVFIFRPFCKSKKSKVA